MSTALEDLLTPAEAAQELGVNHDRVRQFCRQGRLGRLLGRIWLISRKELDDFKKIKRVAGNPNFKKNRVAK